MVVLIVVLTAICVGCGKIAEDDLVRLGIPYHAQEEFNYCVPAAIQMWADYDGVSPLPSQTEIFDYMGGAPCYADDATRGVNHFTLTGQDAYLDHVGQLTELKRDQMVSRQITSIDKGIPVVAVVYPQRNHVVILEGGSYAPIEGGWRWDTVIAHNPDPWFGSSFRYSADAWLEDFCVASSPYCQQVISSSGSSGWFDNHSSYGDSVVLYGQITQEYKD